MEELVHVASSVEADLSYSDGEHQVHIFDGRQIGHNLNESGFQLTWDAALAEEGVPSPTPTDAQFHCGAATRIAKATVPGCSHVFPISFMIRSARLVAEAQKHASEDPLTAAQIGKSLSGPAGRVHCDHTEQTAWTLCHRLLPNLKTVLSGDLRSTDARDDKHEPTFASIVNVWMPLATVLRDPLALVDFRTSDPCSEYCMPLSTPHSGSHHWWYFPAMDRGEAMVFKQFDSRQSVARFAIHTAFALAGTSELPPRESIEVRCLCLGGHSADQLAACFIPLEKAEPPPRSRNFTWWPDIREPGAENDPSRW
eukprot:TRINITY_DN58512_c0_g1_i1.p1 TRINITY_DN58512_c0_g1~~TRINITY_DN58512_c0_g1_i1.p1  ORF type:complete len:320 (+),score=49.02 TRINITY_DN58512_c0_g1_i1:30-962(+)